MERSGGRTPNAAAPAAIDPELGPELATRPWRRTRAMPAPAVLSAVALGGALGTVGRAALENFWPASTGAFPWATFVVNLSGSALLGFLVAGVLERLSSNRLARPFLATGICGGYTTFSTLAVEVDLLVRAGDAGLAVAYAAASIVGGLAAVMAGISLGRACWPGARTK